MKNKLRKLWTLLSMNKAKVMSVVRHILTGLGALLIAKGWIEESFVEEVIGFVLTLTGLLWSFNDKTETGE